MPQFVPFAGTVGGWIGATGTATQVAAAGGTAILSAAGTAAAVGTSATAMSAQGTATKKAADAYNQQQSAAIQEVQDAGKMASSNAMEALKARQRVRANERTIFTDPLGIAGQANVARKTLLGQ